MASCFQQKRLSHELRELRENNNQGDERKETAKATRTRKQQRNGEEECRFFASFAEFVVSSSFTCLAVTVFA
jgi:hypothetical protein